MVILTGGGCSHGHLSVCIHVKVSISAVIRHITDNLKLNFEKNKVVLGYPIRVEMLTVTAAATAGGAEQPGEGLRAG